jgi:Xaa-Pro aminopeptidase
MLKNDNGLKDNLKGVFLTKTDSSKIVYIDSIVSEMRVIKSRYEVENIRKAIDVTSNALANAMRTIKPGMYEYEIAALFDFEYKRNGVKESFPSICGSGVNSTALHYETNNKLMASGDVLLMDVGAEYVGYAADVTRTIPVNGKFSRLQLDLYEIVLKAQEEAIKVMKPGKRFMDFHNKSSDIIVKGLFRLGLMTDTTKTWQKNVFILYRAGHYLGLNVHDVGRYGEDISVFRPGPGRELVAGMVITVEPGIYINPEMLKFIYDIYGSTVPKTELDDFVKRVAPAFSKYANIGIRIEDDILITNSGNENLSQAIPKQPEAIERLMNKK